MGRRGDELRHSRTHESRPVSTRAPLGKYQCLFKGPFKGSRKGDIDIDVDMDIDSDMAVYQY